VPPESGIPGSPSDWLRRAHADLALAKVPLPSGALYYDLTSLDTQSGELRLRRGPGAMWRKEGSSLERG
jgi:hypothetical protein